MKTNLIGLSLLIILLIFLISCNETTTNAEISKGKILLKVDRLNAPSSVVYVVATLTRDGYSPIISTLNLLSDSTADLLLNDIQAGPWHLNVDAMNDSMVVLYSGEADVTILAGFTTQINLTLQPTGQGTGAIYIYVNWGGNSQNSWIDNPNNPVLSGTNHNFDEGGVRYPHVLYYEGNYKMWYTTLASGGIGSIGYAVSIDGINWTRPVIGPVITRGSYFDWDGYSVAVGAVIIENNQFKLFYSGVSQTNQSGIGLAVSNDGINWTKNNQPLLVNEDGEDLITVDEVIKIGNQYLMYYSSRKFNYYSIKLAISSDGINWTRYSSNPILTANQSWEGLGVYAPSVYYDGNKYHMVYMNANANAFGEAISSNGVQWTKISNQPFWSTNNINWAYSIQYPYWRIFSNQLRLYYAGTNSFGDNIGLATK